MMHHYQSMVGNWSYAMMPYYRENLTEYLTDYRAKLLADIIDPYGRYLLIVFLYLRLRKLPWAWPDSHDCPPKTLTSHILIFNQ